MSASQGMPPRKSVPAPQPTLLQRLREIVTSPNAIRTASVAAFFVIWEYYGRRMDPIFMAPPSAICCRSCPLTPDWKIFDSNSAGSTSVAR